MAGDARAPEARRAALGTLTRERAGTCLLTDFDGTLAAIVADAAAARPLPGAVDTLVALAGAYGRVAVVSGRPAGFLLDRIGLRPPLPPALRLSGLYGLEEVGEDGRVHVMPAAEPWREVVAAAAERAEAGAPGGARVERKGLSVTLHWREHPETEDWARRFAAGAVDELGLALHDARRSVELRPPLAVDKGSAVQGLAEGFSTACYLGDDVGDLPAFSALDRLAAAGGRAVKVAAQSEEAPDELVAAADVVVDGPEGALAFLSDLVP